MSTLPLELCLPNGLRVFAGDLGGLHPDLVDRLERQGFEVRGVDGTATLVESVRSRDDVDVLVLFARSVDSETLRIIEQLAGDPGKPLAMFCEDADRTVIQKAVTAGVNAYVVTGLTASRLQAGVNLALANHSCTSGLKEELDEAKQALRERRIIERAKGIVMSRRGLDEDAAYKLLRTRAMQRGLRLAEVAQALADADDLIG